MVMWCGWGIGGERTGNGEITKQFIRVGRTQPLDEVNAGELSANDGCHVKGLELVQDTAQLEGLLVVLEALGEGLLLRCGAVSTVGGRGGCSLGRLDLGFGLGGSLHWLDLEGLGSRLSGFRNDFLFLDLDGEDLGLDLIYRLLDGLDSGGRHDACCGCGCGCV